MVKSEIKKQNTRKPSRLLRTFSIFLVLTVALAGISGIAGAIHADVDTPTPASQTYGQGLGGIGLNITFNASKYPYGYFDNVTVLMPSQDNVYQTLSSPTQVLEIPERFDLRDEGRTPPLKNQHPFNDCWAFAGLGSIKSNLLTKDKTNYTGLDLSEHHLAYFGNHINHTKNISELSGISNDISYMVPQEDYMDNGAVFFIPMTTLMSWIGPVDANAAFHPTDRKQLVDLDEKLAYYANEAHVQNVTLITAQNMDAIKATLMKQGAGAITFEWNESIDEKTSEFYYLNKTEVGNEYSYNYPYAAFGNHAVMLIGWDDNFKKENFKVQPECDGAWLIQNSWGDIFGQYIWISYNDSVISNPGTVFRFYDAEPVTNYDNNYQYDGSSGIDFCPIAGKDNMSTATIANVFTATTQEYLKAVSFATLQPDVHYSIQVYHNLLENQVIGEPLLSTPVTGVTQYLGYHTIPLPEGLLLSENGEEDRFSVVVNMTVYDGGGMAVTCEKISAVPTIYSKPHIEEKQSYLFDTDNNTWMDFANLQKDGYGNLRIKAYTVNANPEGSERFAGGDGSLENPYEIETPEQLDFVRYGLGKHYKLISDIDLSGYTEGNGWNPIGTEDLSQFYGSLDGAGHTISNLTIYRPDANEVGLFGRTHNANIMNLTLENVNVTGNNSVGGLVGHNLASHFGPKAIDSDSSFVFSMIRSCHVSGTVIGKGNSVGGLIGTNSATGSLGESLVNYVFAVSKSSAEGYVAGSDSVGGLIGQNIATDMTQSTITDSYATSNVLGKNAVGGLVGYHNSNVSQVLIRNCYATGGVNGEDYVGGIVGSSTDDVNGGALDRGFGTFVNNSVALNPFVFGMGTNVSRVIGEGSNGVVSSANYATLSMVCSNAEGEVATGAKVDDTPRSETIYGEDVTQKAAKSAEFYTNTLGWNFDAVWKMNDGYPYPLFQSSDNVPALATEIRELPLPTASGRYILGADILMDSTWNAPVGITILDLNGFNITLTDNEKSVVSVTNDAVLFITDSSENAAGQISHLQDAIVGENDNDASICDDLFGGGVYIENGVLIQAGGAISKNAARHGGGVCIAHGVFLLDRGSISDNVAKEIGGGVLVFKDEDIEGEAIFVQLGGEISKNTALTESGGGVAVIDGKFALVRGNIANNFANATGGGVFISSGDVLVSGGCVANNLAGENKDTSNVYLNTGKTLIISERGMENETSIGVSTKDVPMTGSSVAITGENDDEFTRYFFSDNVLYHIETGVGNVSYLVKTEPVAPALPVSDITVDSDNNVTIVVSGGATVDEEDKRNVRIEDSNTGVALKITFDSPQSETSTSFGGHVIQAVAEYPKSATVPNSTIDRVVDVSYTLNITLENVTNLLPEIDATINETVRELVESHELGLEMATMITAVGENVSRVNGNITENGVSLVFTVPASWYESMKGGVFMFHVKDGAFDVDGGSPVKVVGVKNGDVYEIQVIGSTFSSYGIAGKPEANPEPTPEPTPRSGGGSSGSSTWATVTPTPTVTPTATPTSAPTDAPTGAPTATGSAQAKTPVPVLGLILGGVTLAFVLRRK